MFPLLQPEMAPVSICFFMVIGICFLMTGLLVTPLDWKFTVINLFCLLSVALLERRYELVQMTQASNPEIAVMCARCPPTFLLSLQCQSLASSCNVQIAVSSELMMELSNPIQREILDEIDVWHLLAIYGLPVPMKRQSRDCEEMLNPGSLRDKLKILSIYNFIIYVAFSVCVWDLSVTSCSVVILSHLYPSNPVPVRWWLKLQHAVVLHINVNICLSVCSMSMNLLLDFFSVVLSFVQPCVEQDFFPVATLVRFVLRQSKEGCRWVVGAMDPQEEDPPF